MIDNDFHNASVIISGILEVERVDAGDYRLDLYMKTNKDAFEELDCRAELPSFKREGNLIMSNDPDQVFIKKITEKILDVLKPLINKETYVRVIASVDGEITVSVTK